jgi:ADP-heptose:LPS heptosyltransferase
VESVLDRLPAGSRVAVLRLRSLGDCVLSTPAVDLLKRYRPDLKIAVMVEDRFRAIFEENPDLDEILPVQLGRLRAWKPHLCLNFHGGTRTAWLTAASGARFRAGFAHYRHIAAYNLRIPTAQQILNVSRKVHTAEHLASAIFWLGVPKTEIPRAKLSVASITKQFGRPVLLHPVAATPEKTWPSERFLSLAGQLKNAGYEPIFIGAASDNLSPFRAFRTISGAPLSDIKSLLATASLFIGNDSGPAHMAAAFGLPVVVIFGPSDPEIWGPWRTASEVITTPDGIASVAVEQVLGALSRMRVHA